MGPSLSANAAQAEIPPGGSGVPRPVAKEFQDYEGSSPGSCPGARARAPLRHALAPRCVAERHGSRRAGAAVPVSPTRSAAAAGLWCRDGALPSEREHGVSGE